MLKRTTKRTTVILLALVMSLGLFVAGYGDTQGSQDVTANISTELILTKPNALGTWQLSYNESDQVNSDSSKSESTGDHTVVVEANQPYTVEVKISQHPSGETKDQKMTAVNGASTVDLTNPLEIGYDAGGDSQVTSGAAAAPFDSFNTVTTASSAETFYEEDAPPDDGLDYIYVKYQQTTKKGDPAEQGTTTLNYEIQLTWTASANI